MKKLICTLIYISLTVPCLARIITVDDDGPADFNNIQAAIDDANDSDIVEVQPGTYTGSGDRNISFLGKAITVRSTDPNNLDTVKSTVIDVGGVPGYNRRGFRFTSGEGPNSVLAGFTIKNGFISDTASNGVPYGGDGSNGVALGGGGIMCLNNSDPTIRNCLIWDCRAYGENGGKGASGTTTGPPFPIGGGDGGDGGRGFGGGIYCDSTSSPIISNCDVNNCVVRGGNGGDGGDGESVPDPNFATGEGGYGGNGNDGFGGGIALMEGSNALIINCTVRDCCSITSIGGTAGHGTVTHANGVGGFAYGGGIYLENSSPTISYCHIIGNQTSGGAKGDGTNPGEDGGNGGGICSISSSLVIENCEICNNTTGNGGSILFGYQPAGDAGNGAGVYCSSSSVTIQGCTIVNNTTGEGGNWDEVGDDTAGAGGDGGGVYCDSSSSLVISDSNLTGNQTGKGGSADYGKGGRTGRGGAIYCVSSAALEINDCTIKNNRTANGAFGEYWSASGGNGGGIYCTEAVITDSVISNNITGNGNSTINGSAGGKGGGVYCSSLLTLTGCTVEDNTTGSGQGDDSGGIGGDGGGIYCGSADISDCNILSNTTGDGADAFADSYRGGHGGGIYCNSSAEISNCTISANATGNGGNDGSGGSGGGVFCSSSAEISNCMISHNITGYGSFGPFNGGNGGSGAGVYCNSLSTIRNCIIYANITGDGADGIEDVGSGGSGAGIYCKSLADISSCIVFDNVTGDGGDSYFNEGPAADGGKGAGIFCGSSSVTIKGCTIVDNITGDGGFGSPDGDRGEGAGVYAQTNTVITNSILWDNESDQLYGQDCNNVSYSDIADGICGGGTGNINTDPCFVNADSNDFHLQQDSPCINTGDPNYIPEPNETDIDNQPRVTQGRIDMGADEKTTECYVWQGQSQSEYDYWVDSNRPECWCYPRQCHGDADGKRGGSLYWGIYWVGTEDLDIMSLGWLVKDPPKGSGILGLEFDGVPVACADFARDKQGNAYLGYWRIGSDDLDEMSLYWMVKEPPKGSGTPPDCLPGNVEPLSEPIVEYEISPCDMALSAEEQSDDTRFNVTVQGSYILFEDTMSANCCPQQIWLEMETDNNQITIYEHEAGGVCFCICFYPVTATMGPFEPGTYTIDVYEDWSGFIGSTTVDIE